MQHAGVGQGSHTVRMNYTMLHMYYPIYGGVGVGGGKVYIYINTKLL